MNNLDEIRQLMDKKDFVHALPLFQQCSDSELASNTDLGYLLGLCRFSLSDFKAAYDGLTVLNLACPGEIRVIYLIGRCLEEMGQEIEAVAMFEACLRQPKCPRFIQVRLDALRPALQATSAPDSVSRYQVPTDEEALSSFSHRLGMADAHTQLAYTGTLLGVEPGSIKKIYRAVMIITAVLVFVAIVMTVVNVLSFSSALTGVDTKAMPPASTEADVRRRLTNKKERKHREMFDR